VALALVLMGGVAACSRGAAPIGSRAAPALALVTPQTGGAGAPPAADRAMRITIETTIVVAHRDAAVAALRAAVNAAGGYVSEGTISGADDGGSASFTLKVPAHVVANFRTKIAQLGDVTSDSEKAEDVTEARADLQARLHNARAEEQRLLELLANRTGTIADVVVVEKELAQVRETIERLEAEQKTLEGQIAFATVTVKLQTAYVAVRERVGHSLAVAAGDGMENAKGFVIGTLTFALACGPTFLLLAIGVYVLIRAVRAWRRRGRSKPLPAATAG
jgi:hypothetical protein